MLLFGVGAVCCFAVAAEYPDLGIWGVVSLVLAVFSFLGWRGKRKDNLKQAILLDAARAQIAMTGAGPTIEARRVVQLSGQTLGVAGGDVICPNCSTANSANARFCSSCGGTLAPHR